MKIIKYILIALSPIALSSCNLITVDNLEDDIKDQFEHSSPSDSNPAGLNNAQYSSECELDVKSYCLLQNNAAFELDLLGTSRGYKYYFDDERLSDWEIIAQLSKKDYNEGKDRNIITVSYNTGYYPLYLYFTGFESRSIYGPSYEFKIPVNEISSFGNRATISAFTVSGGVVGWTVSASAKGSTSGYYNYQYFALTDKEAETAEKMGDAELWLTYGDRATTVTATSALKEFSMSKPGKLLVVTRCMKNSTELAGVISRRYQSKL